MECSVLYNITHKKMIYFSVHCISTRKYSVTRHFLIDEQNKNPNYKKKSQRIIIGARRNENINFMVILKKISILSIDILRINSEYL